MPKLKLSDGTFYPYIPSICECSEHCNTIIYRGKFVYGHQNKGRPSHWKGKPIHPNLSRAVSERNKKLIGELNPQYGMKGELSTWYERKHTPEEIEKIRIANTGIIHSKDSYIRSSKSIKEFFRLNPDIVKKSREKAVQSRLHMFSALDHLVKDKYCPLFTPKLREEVRIRDDHICQLCGKTQSIRNHCVHHIHYDKPNCYPDLVCLCTGCNSKVNKKSLRKYYENLFMNMLNDRQLLFWTKRRNNSSVNLS